MCFTKKEQWQTCGYLQLEFKFNTQAMKHIRSVKENNIFFFYLWNNNPICFSIVLGSGSPFHKLKHVPFFSSKYFCLLAIHSLQPLLHNRQMFRCLGVYHAWRRRHMAWLQWSVMSVSEATFWTPTWASPHKGARHVTSMCSNNNTNCVLMWLYAYSQWISLSLSIMQATWSGCENTPFLF